MCSEAMCKRPRSDSRGGILDTNSARIVWDMENGVELRVWLGRYSMKETRRDCPQEIPMASTLMLPLQAVDCLRHLDELVSCGERKRYRSILIECIGRRPGMFWGGSQVEGQ